MGDKKTSHGGHFYPRPPRGGRPSFSRGFPEPFNISIHALREEGDPMTKPCSSKLLVFLSTPSARRATSRGWGGRPLA